MSESGLVVGATVCLRSGGPLMTIVERRGKGGWSTVAGAECVWFEDTAKHVDWFPLAALELTAPLTFAMRQTKP